MESYEFGTFRLDAELRSLTKSGHAVPLTPKAVELLLVLVRNAGSVLDKEFLLNAVWPETAVEEGILAVNIATIRKALQDGDGPGCIETVPRRGYRFVAAVRSPSLANRRQPRLWVTGSITTALLAAAALTIRSGKPPAPPRLTPFAVEAATEIWPAYSPSGDAVAYLRGRPADFDLVVTASEQPEPLVLATHLRAGRVVWNASGSHVCFNRDDDLWCVGAAGGQPALLLRQIGSAALGLGDAVWFIHNDPPGKPKLMRASSGEEPVRMPVDLPDSIREIVSPLSPDGSRVVAADATGDCWVVPVSGGAARRAGFRARAVSWFPGGRQMMYSEARSNAGGALYISDGDGPGRPVIQTPSAIHSVSLRPDGRRALISTGAADWNIVEHQVTGEFLREVVATSAQETAPDWSPVGDRFLYVGNSAGPYGVWIGPRMLAPIPVSRYAKPRFSPDGRQIAFVDSAGLRLAPERGGAAITLMASNAHISSLCWSGTQVYFASQGTIRRVATSGGASVEVRPGTFVVDCSSDGRWIAYSDTPGRDLYSTSGRVRVMNPAGESFDLASGTAIAGAFSRDGKRYYGIQKDQRSLLEWDIASRRPLRTIPLRVGEHDGVFDVSVHPDGKRMLLMSGALRHDLWLAEDW